MKVPSPKRVALGVGAMAVIGLAATSGILVARLTGARGFPVNRLHQGVNLANLQITPMFVVREGQRVIALRPFAPGGQTPVAWCPERRFFEDPSTGSKFDESGRYLAGTATTGLERFQSKVVSGVLQVAPGVVIAGTARPAEIPATSLPACNWPTARFAPGVAIPASPTPE